MHAHAQRQRAVLHDGKCFVPQMEHKRILRRIRQLADVLRFYLTRGLRKQSILFAELLQRFKTGHALYAAYAGGNGGFAYDVEKSYLCGVVNVRTAAEFG